MTNIPAPRAIILAAGIGKRMASITHSMPKCLLEFNGKTLLERHLDNCAALGVAEVTLVVGFAREAIEKHLDRSCYRSAHVHCVMNPDFQSGSVLSLWHARAALMEHEAVVLLDADVLCHPEIYRRLIETNDSNLVLLDQNFEDGEEPVKVAIKDKCIVAMDKALQSDVACDIIGESVGFFRFTGKMAADVARACDRYVALGRHAAPHEWVLRDLMVNNQQFTYTDITGLPWIELDFPEDVAKARKTILPQIEPGLPPL